MCEREGGVIRWVRVGSSSEAWAQWGWCVRRAGRGCTRRALGGGVEGGCCSPLYPILRASCGPCGRLLPLWPARVLLRRLLQPPLHAAAACRELVTSYLEQGGPPEWYDRQKRQARARERRQQREAAKRRGRVVVVGAGPSGLTAALHLKAGWGLLLGPLAVLPPEWRGGGGGCCRMLGCRCSNRLWCCWVLVPLLLREVVVVAAAADLLPCSYRRRRRSCCCGGWPNRRPATVLALTGCHPPPSWASAHLQRQGVEVVVLEARGRVGGRVHSHSEPGLGAPVDLGASIITGALCRI